MKKILLFPIALMMWLTEAQANEPDPYSSQGRCGDIDLFANVFIWKASEETSSNWANVLTETSANTFVFEAKDLTFPWDFGFRLGGGYHFPCSQWDTQFYWTWFRTSARDSIPNTGAIVFTEFFAGFVVDRDTGQSGEIKWELLYNMFDWEWGYSYWVTRNLLFRPFIGLKGGWIDQTIDSKWENEKLLPDLSVLRFSSSEDLKNDFWGIGPSGGVNSKWKLGNCSTRFFSLFGDLSTAMMWGVWRCSDAYNNSTSTEIFVNMKDSVLGALMLRGFFGIGWDSDLCNGRFHFASQLGYEMQFWLNQLRIPTFQQLRLHGDLTLQGGTWTFRFGF